MARCGPQFAGAHDGHGALLREMLGQRFKRSECRRHDRGKLRHPVRRECVRPTRVLAHADARGLERANEQTQRNRSRCIRELAERSATEERHNGYVRRPIPRKPAHGPTSVTRGPGGTSRGFAERARPMPLAWLFALLVSLIALPAQAEVLRIDGAGPPARDAGGALAVADDADDTLTLAQVRRSPQIFGAPERLAPPRYQPHRYWLRIVLVSGLDHDTKLSIEAPSWDIVDYAVVHADGSLTEIHAGARVPFRGSAYASFVLRTGESATVFAHVMSVGRFLTPQFSLSLARFDDLLEQTQFKIYLDGIILGVLFALAVYSLVLLAATREPSYLWYALYLIAIAVSSGAGSNLPLASFNRLLLADHPAEAI